MSKIAIVGGGPAGSSFALNLVRAGVDPADLVLYDKARFPRPKLCGGALTFRGTEALHALIGEPEGGARTDGITFRSAAGDIVVQERGGQWLYDRAELDHRLLTAVVEAGVEVREETPVKAIAPTTDGWRVDSGGGHQTFRWLIGADGACGITRRASGLRGGIVGRLVEAVYEPVSAELEPGLLHFDFDPVVEGIPGYAWAFPYPKPGEDDVARYWKLGIMDGRGKVGGKALREWTDRFAERLGFRRVEDSIAGWPERYHHWRAQGHRPGLMLVGEAFGIDPLLGEGIAPALYHAAYAARRLRGALDAGADRVRGYELAYLFEPEGKNLWFQAQLANLIYGAAGVRWLRVLFDLPRLRQLAEAGNDAYGRLACRMPSLLLSWTRYLMTRGLPSSDPAGLRLTPGSSA